MGRIIIIILVAVVFVLTTGLLTASAQPRDPVGVVDAYTAAINAGDVEGALAFVADNAVYMRPAGQFIGKDQVRGFIQDLVARGARIELQGDRDTVRDYVSWISRVTFANPGSGPSEIRNLAQSIVVDGKIVFHMAYPSPY